MLVLLLCASAAALAALVFLARGSRWTGFAGKTLWDWLQLLVIPLALALLAFVLNVFENERDRRREADQTARAESLAAERAREDALDAYLDRMSDLLLNEHLQSSRPGSEVQTVARSLTLTVVRRLDPARKGLVIRFLAESRLLGLDPRRKVVVTPRSRTVTNDVPPPVSLGDADLRGVMLDRATLFAADFSEADLRGARFRDAVVAGSSFEAADLRGADFTGADFHGGILTGGGAGPRPAFGIADLEGACVSDARFAGAQLQQAIFSVVGRDVVLTRADLRGADLRFATLRDTDVTGARLSGARLPRRWGQPGAEPSRARVDALCVISPTGFDPATLPP